MFQELPLKNEVDNFKSNMMAIFFTPVMMKTLMKSPKYLQSYVAVLFPFFCYQSGEIFFSLAPVV